MIETVPQLKKLHAIENVEHAIFALERGMPVPPRVIETLKMLYQVMINDYNASIIEAAEEAELREKVESAQESGGVEETPSVDDSESPE